MLNLDFFWLPGARHNITGGTLTVKQSLFPTDCFKIHFFFSLFEIQLICEQKIGFMKCWEAPPCEDSDLQKKVLQFFDQWLCFLV